MFPEKPVACAARSPAVSCVLLWLRTVTHSSASQVFVLVAAGPCPGRHEGAPSLALAQSLMLPEAGAAYPNSSLLGDSQNTQVTTCSTSRYSGTKTHSQMLPVVQQQTPVTFPPLLFHVAPQLQMLWLQ